VSIWRTCRIGWAASLPVCRRGAARPNTMPGWRHAPRKRRGPKTINPRPINPRPIDPAEPISLNSSGSYRPGCSGRHLVAAAASMLARCIAGDDAEKFFGAVGTPFKLQDRLMDQTKDTLKLIGKQNGLSDQAVESCEKDQTLLDKLSADQKFAYEILKVDATPTFFTHGEMLKGAMSFEELDAKLKAPQKNSRLGSVVN
jgi:hypothetical protein